MPRVRRFPMHPTHRAIMGGIERRHAMNLQHELRTKGLQEQAIMSGLVTTERPSKDAQPLFTTGGLFGKKTPYYRVPTTMEEKTIAGHKGVLMRGPGGELSFKFAPTTTTTLQDKTAKFMVGDDEYSQIYTFNPKTGDREAQGPPFLSGTGQSKTSLQLKTRKYIKNGREYSQDFTFNPKTSAQEDVGEPYLSGAGIGASDTATKNLRERVMASLRTAYGAPRNTVGQIMTIRDPNKKLIRIKGWLKKRDMETSKLKRLTPEELNSVEQDIMTELEVPFEIQSQLSAARMAGATTKELMILLDEGFKNIISPPE